MYKHIFMHEGLSGLLEAISSLEENITELSLSGNSFGHITNEEIIKVFAEIPPAVIKLHIHRCALFGKSTSELDACLAAILSSVRYIDLSFNHLFRYRSHTERDELLSILRSTARSYDLTANGESDTSVSHLS